jgi:hypothetical protein
MKPKKQEASILKYLDERIMGYFQQTLNYPSKIIVSKESEGKIMKELLAETGLDLSWKDNSLKNYKGIPVEIKDVSLIELKGE